MTSSAANERLRLANRRYFRRNIVFTLVLLAVWFAAGLGCGVLLVEPLNAYRLGGVPLGFWFAQQGAIVVFVVLILLYAIAMTLLDRAHRRALAALAAECDAS
ncbi:MAG: DUF4212 domain-containing protein [Planctomycetes bacterium]|nr:DUF4212 domain-containing protein [Planctomycetota bacterium]